MSSHPSTTTYQADVEAAQQRLEAARQLAKAASLNYAGSIPPQDAWILFNHGLAKLIDVRSTEELKFVGHVPGSGHVAWMTGASLMRNPRFIGELSKKAGKDEVILFLCRSGKRSASAAEAATKAGYTQVFNVLEGFEGELNDGQQRGHQGGWRYYGLPWAQN